jgi:hypothetical protein
MYKPAYRCLEIQQRIDNSWNFRIKAGTTYADLTSYEAKAQVWNKERTELKHELTVDWQNRIISNDQTQWHFTLSIADADTLISSDGEMWDLMLIEPDGREIFIMRGPVFYLPGFTDTQ